MDSTPEPPSDEVLKETPSDEDKPRRQSRSLDSVTDPSTQHNDESQIQKLFKTLHDVDHTINKKLGALENIDITIQIISFKNFEATHEFKNKISDVKKERNQVLLSIHNTSELSLILNDLDKKITDLEEQLAEQIQTLNVQKIELQQKSEAIAAQLDEDLVEMQEIMKQVKEELGVKMDTMHKAQVLLINQKYTPELNLLENNILNHEKIQMTGWKIQHSEEKLSELLEEQGIKCTPSGKLITRTGSCITFQEAQNQGYFKNIGVSLHKMAEFFKEHEQQQQALAQVGPSDATYSEGSTVQSKISSEDVKYLKEAVGKPLTLALAEITAKQPRDPIHYLGHYLFKYRYNQELEEIRKKEIEELTEQRKIKAKEQWKKFVEQEAKNAVIDMILRAEELAGQNEMERAEQEQMMQDEEIRASTTEELEEARDKFE